MRQKTDFDRFWDHGMKLRSGVGGNGPKPAAIFFNKLVKEGIDPERIIAGIAAYIHFIQPRVQPDKQPSAVKWLNEWRWEEDAGDGVALADAEIPVYRKLTEKEAWYWERSRYNHCPATVPEGRDARPPDWEEIDQRHMN